MRHALLVLALAGSGAFARAADLPIFDAHLHYSHDAWEQLPAKEAIALLRKAGVRRAHGVELERRGHRSGSTPRRRT